MNGWVCRWDEREWLARSTACPDRWRPESRGAASNRTTRGGPWQSRPTGSRLETQCLQGCCAMANRWSWNDLLRRGSRMSRPVEERLPRTRATAARRPSWRFFLACAMARGITAAIRAAPRSTGRLLPHRACVPSPWAAPGGAKHLHDCPRDGLYRP